LEAERKRKAEEDARQNQIDELSKLEKEILSNNARSNPMYEQIQQCDELLKFCKKGGEVEEEVKEADGPSDQKRVNKDLEKKLASGSL